MKIIKVVEGKIDEKNIVGRYTKTMSSLSKQLDTAISEAPKILTYLSGFEKNEVFVTTQEEVSRERNFEKWVEIFLYGYADEDGTTYRILEEGQ